MSYIINAKKEIVATTTSFIKSGTRVQFSSQACKESINAGRDHNLANASAGVISNSAKIGQLAARMEYVPMAQEINEREFLVA